MENFHIWIIREKEDRLHNPRSDSAGEKGKGGSCMVTIFKNCFEIIIAFF